MSERPEDASSIAPPSTAETRLPLFEEAAQVETRDVPGERVRLHTSVREHDERIDAALRGESVTVERVPINRVVATAPGVSEEGDTLIVPVVEEQLVIEKRLVLKEIVRVTRHARTRTEQHTVRLRAEDVRIERIAASDDPHKSDNQQTEQKG
ncbi:MAG: YsnF/AvaK domain-containing protein [Alphaproteobacteria bacterium]|nr:YsnF/AvaK domain-containing protein [Alphaproteobacteria bacterium]